ncbi:hypothetical protein XAP3CFBP6996_022245 [Xanthomonas citri pv. fuscans CFBP 6996]|uniref:Uncharacterized protein n=1 Tax=Xanthomonas citri pv. phaseoli var. fuscans TaxID=473423 RepID=A0AB33FEY2_XANCI|nr:hypothetical protein XAP3CFBP6996_022245 [Xanthomonas citri pv. fuscans CFBP 6996]QWN06008.1 hypothetical protein DGN16_23490 [Xanthomonas citri pv. fuscans]QWN10148.1 hypothetical protein DGN11_22670 [Xanthomonas citri pv. fuscans]QWN18715.1 hypothetical protein DGN02_23205 [Xanthomonas citri]QWN22964.1 hypothetical protein DGM98_23010 [Xanthomonas citri]
MSCDSVIGFWQFKRGRDRTRSPAWGAAHRCRVPRHRQSARILAPARSACRSRRATRPHATEDARHPIERESGSAGSEVWSWWCARPLERWLASEAARCRAWPGTRRRERPGATTPGIAASVLWVGRAIACMTACMQACKSVLCRCAKTLHTTSGEMPCITKTKRMKSSP